MKQAEVYYVNHGKITKTETTVAIVISSNNRVVMH